MWGAVGCFAVELTPVTRPARKEPHHGAIRSSALEVSCPSVPVAASVEESRTKTELRM